MKLLPAHDLQLINERMYSRSHIDGYLSMEMAGNQEVEAKVLHGITLLEDWLAKGYYQSKNDRLNQLKNLDLDRLVRDVFIGVAYCLEPVLFTSISAQLAGRLKFSDKADGIVTIAEILAVLCITDAFDIHKDNAQASLMLVSRIPLSTQLTNFIQQSEYLPPMVCEPETVENNYSSGYLTVGSDSLILGKGNHHNGDICLDVINTQNQVPLKLDTDFLTTVEEEPTFELDSPEKLQQWHTFKRQSYIFYDLMIAQGNRFYLTHKVDKRGRIYAQGYHITTQGTAFKKASIELADEELVEGVPQ